MEQKLDSDYLLSYGFVKLPSIDKNSKLSENEWYTLCAHYVHVGAPEDGYTLVSNHDGWEYIVQVKDTILLFEDIAFYLNEERHQELEKLEDRNRFCVLKRIFKFNNGKIIPCILQDEAHRTFWPYKEDTNEIDINYYGSPACLIALNSTMKEFYFLRGGLIVHISIHESLDKFYCNMANNSVPSCYLTTKNRVYLLEFIEDDEVDYHWFSRNQLPKLIDDEVTGMSRVPFKIENHLPDFFLFDEINPLPTLRKWKEVKRL